MLGLGFQVMSEVGAGLLGGWLIARWTGWSWALPIGGIAGIVVGITTMVRQAWKLNAQLDRSAGERTAGRGSSEASGDAEARDRPRADEGVP
jgi:MFS family permease